MSSIIFSTAHLLVPLLVGAAGLPLLQLAPYAGSAPVLGVQPTRVRISLQFALGASVDQLGLGFHLSLRDGVGLGYVLDGLVAALVNVLAVDEERLAGDGVGDRAVVDVLVSNVCNLGMEDEGKKSRAVSTVRERRGKSKDGEACIARVYTCLVLGVWCSVSIAPLSRFSMAGTLLHFCSILAHILTYL